MSGKTDPTKDPKVIRRMTQLLMQGAVMLAETCPICGLPLFRLRSGETVCPVHGRIILVSSEEEAREVEVDAVIASVEHYAASRLRQLMEEGDPQGMIDWLRVIELTERIRSLRGERKKPREEGKGGVK